MEPHRKPDRQERGTLDPIAVLGTADALLHPVRETAEWKRAVMTLSLLPASGLAGEIGIFTDFDGDGTTSAALVARALRTLDGTLPRTFVNRVELGFGLNADGLSELAGCRLVLVLDSGTGTADGNAALAGRPAGMRVLVIDHHPPQDVAGLGEGVEVLNPHLLGFGDGFRNATLCYLLARDVLAARGGLDAAAEAELLALGMAGGYTDCIQDNESPLHDAMRAKADGTHAAYARRTAYAGSPALAELLRRNALALGADPDSEWLTGREMSAITDTLGIGKWDEGVEDSSLPYRLLVEHDPAAYVPLAGELAGLGTDLRESLDAAKRTGIAKAEVLPNGLVATVLTEADLPGRYRGNAGRVAKAVCSGLGPADGRPPVFAFLETGSGTYKLSWRGDAASDPAGTFRMEEFAAGLKDRLPETFLGGGGHRYAGSLTVAGDRLAEARAALAALPVDFTAARGKA